MKPSIPRLLALSLLLAPSIPFAAEPAASGCDAFSWNVSREVALMAQAATSIDAARSGRATPVETGKHYAVHLAPQADVKFALAPARSRNAQGAYAGMVRLRVEHAGRYRVSLTSRHWIDIVDGDHAIDSLDFQGRHGCDRLHKVVEFDLPQGRDLILQFSGDDAATADLAITPAPQA